MDCLLGSANLKRGLKGEPKKLQKTYHSVGFLVERSGLKRSIVMQFLPYYNPKQAIKIFTNTMMKRPEECYVGTFVDKVCVRLCSKQFALF